MSTGNIGCCGQTPSLHGAAGRLRDYQLVNEWEIISRACAFLKEKGLTQRRSPTRTRKLISFENPKENREWEMPVGVGRQNDRWSDRKAERR